MLDVSIDLAELETEPGGAGVVGVSLEVTELEAEIFVTQERWRWKCLMIG